MSEYNEFISQQTVPPYGGQLTAESDWSGRVEDEHPADQEPPQAAAPAPEEPPADAEASPEEPEDAAPEADAVQEAEAVAESAPAPEADAVPDAESQTAEEVEEPEAGSDGQAVDDLTAEHLIDPADAERFQSGWSEVKAAFVDGPSDAVQQASVLVGVAVDEVTTALTRLRQNLDRQSQDTDQADTEQLRQVLRGYGSLLDHILTR